MPPRRWYSGVLAPVCLFQWLSGEVQRGVCYTHCNVRPGFSEVYYIHVVEQLAVWVGGCRGGILGVEGDTPYLIRRWPVFRFTTLNVADPMTLRLRT